VVAGVAVWAASPAAAVPASPAPFSASIERVRWEDLRHSYRVGCPVPPARLRTLAVSYWDFGGRARTGRIVVGRRVATEVVTVFRRLWLARFPLRRLQPVSAYRGDDDASMAADNTSGFNCRPVEGTSRWSLHAYGEAIDVNPVENPYVRGSRVEPPAGRAFVDRTHVWPGMAVPGGTLVRAFAAVGWRWGASFGDYQHFSTTGG
jgi:hypothetical protein